MQLLSQSVANSFTLGERRDLAYFISVVNAWFDVMDSRTKYHRYNKIKSGLGVNWEEQEDSLNKRERLEFNMEQVKDPAVQTEHYGGPSSNKKPRMMGLGGKNLLQIYMERLERYVARHSIQYLHQYYLQYPGRPTRNM